MLHSIITKLSERLLFWDRWLHRWTELDQLARDQRTILVFFHGYSLAHTLRPLVLARALRERGYSVECAGRGPHIERIAREGFPIHDVETLPQERMDAYVAQGEYGYYDLAWIDRCVQSERDLIQAIEPALVIQDMKPTLSIAAQLEGVDEAVVTQAYNQPSYPFPIRLMESFSTDPGPFSAYLKRKAREVKPRKKLYLLADIPEFHPSPERSAPGYHYVGPLLDDPQAKGTVAILDQGWDLSWPLVYVTCGSSGHPPEYLEGLIEAVTHKPIRLLITTAGRWEGTSLPSNVRVTDFLPGEWVLQRARALVGIVGIGAIYQALRCGVPIIGAPEHLDQEYHLNRVEQLGLGIKLDRKAFRADEILAALAQVLGDEPKFSESCRAFAKKAKATPWHGGQVAADLVDDFFLAQEKPHQIDSLYAMEKQEFVRHLVASTPLSMEDVETILHEDTGRGLPHHKVHGALYYDRIDSWNWLNDHEPRFFEADYQALEQKRNRFFIRDEKGVRGRKKWQRYRVTYQLHIHPAPLQPGQRTRIFLPYPIEGRGQRDIRHISCKPADMEAVLVPAMGFFYNYERTKGSSESEPWELSYVCELTVEEFPSANGLQPVPLSPIERKRYLRLDPALADCPEIEAFRQELGPRGRCSDEWRARALYEALMHTKRFKKTKDPTQSIGYSTQAILSDTGGHCITLSRAFMALCRLDGIPVREVAGALIGYPTGDDTFAAHSYRDPLFGHTWAEVHLAEKGWIPVEFHGTVIGRNARTDHNVADPVLRGRIEANTDPYWAYYFGHLDTQRIRCSNSVKNIPQCLVERLDAQADDPNRWDFQTELPYECHLQTEILDEG